MHRVSSLRTLASGSFDALVTCCPSAPKQKLFYRDVDNQKNFFVLSGKNKWMLKPNHSLVRRCPVALFLMLILSLMIGQSKGRGKSAVEEVI